jgi:hypothetical protein
MIWGGVKSNSLRITVSGEHSKPECQSNLRHYPLCRPHASRARRGSGHRASQEGHRPPRLEQAQAIVGMGVAHHEPARRQHRQRLVQAAALLAVVAGHGLDHALAVGVRLQAAHAPPAGVAERAVVEVHRVLRRHHADSEGAGVLPSRGVSHSATSSEAPWRQVAASLKPPAAAPRRLLAVVLSTHDAEPRLGDGDEPRVVPDLRPLISREPTPSELSAAFPPDARQTLGLDLSRRWRLIAFETGADPHSLRDDIQLRLLTLAAPRPGEAPLPIVTRGDRPTLPTAPPPPRWWQRRRFKLSLAALLLAALIGAVLWRDRR